MYLEPSVVKLSHNVLCEKNPLCKVLGLVLSPLRLPLVHSALSGVVFCLDFDRFFPSSGVLLPGVYPLFI